MCDFKVASLVASLIAVASANQAGTPFQMTWASRSYGPDGPWQAVTVSIGSPGQQVALYPGGVWASEILTNYICDNKTVSSKCYADEAGGVFHPELSHSYNNESIALLTEGQLPWGLGEVSPYGYGKNAFDSVDIGGASVPMVTMQTINWVYQQYPSGKMVPLEVGILSLGANAVNQSFSEGGSIPALNTTFVDSYLYTSGGGQQTPSYSFGLHIGSAAFNIPGSLMFGGYDQARALGNVSAQAYDGTSFPIELIDIGLGVADGGSPWEFDSKSGLLASGNSSIGQALSVRASPPDPYIYLPRSTCDAIAAQLPVKYNSALNLYYWDTESSQYSDIVSSPAYLGFTFQYNADNSQNFTIKVPFALLNLTLTQPLVDTDTQYFPCYPTQNEFGLGRAFLQAAFMGVNWGTGTGSWFLAQAPGPNFQATPTTTIIAADASSITGSTSNWENSWSGHWKPLSNGSNATSSGAPGSASTSGGDSGGLSKGASAGIGVAVGVAGLALLAALAFYLKRRRNTSRADQDAPNGYISAETSEAGAVANDHHPYTDKDPNKPTLPYYGGPPRPPAELDDGSRLVHELQ